MQQIQIDKSVHDYHQSLVGSIMVQNRQLIDDLKAVSRVMDTSNWLDDISELKLKALKKILEPYSELNK